MTTGTAQIRISDPLAGRRTAEPIEFSVPRDRPEPLWSARTTEGDVVACQRHGSGSGQGTTRFLAVVIFDTGTVLTLLHPIDDTPGSRRQSHS